MSDSWASVRPTVGWDTSAQERELARVCVCVCACVRARLRLSTRTMCWLCSLTAMPCDDALPPSLSPSFPLSLTGQPDADSQHGSESSAQAQHPVLLPGGHQPHHLKDRTRVRVVSTVINMLNLLIPGEPWCFSASLC